MPLPEWAAPPGPGYSHGDSYSSIDVVWTRADPHDVVYQTPNGYRRLAGSEWVEFVVPYRPTVSRKLLMVWAVLAGIVGLGGGAILGHLLR